MASQSEAQRSADRIRLLREQMADPEVQRVLELSPEQQQRFEEWARAQLAELARQFDVDTSASQQGISWGMRIASTMGGIAICAAVVLFFLRFWGNLGTAAQVVIVAAAPLLALGGAEFAASRERTRYFTGLLALVAFASFVMNLAVLGSIFNIAPTERALLAWSAFALAVAYRYGLRLLLAVGLLLLMAYCAAAIAAEFGYHWSDFAERPEVVSLLTLLIFWAPLLVGHKRNPDFPPVYRLVGASVFFACMFSLAESGDNSFLPFTSKNIERLYEFAGLLTSAVAIWLGIARRWKGVVNVSAAAFVIFLFSRLYHWLWNWLPKYLFFAGIGALGIGLVLAFKRLRSEIARRGGLA